MKTLQVFHFSKYTCRPLGGDLPSLDLMTANVRDFLKGCEDITYSDVLNCAIDIKEVDNLVFQVFHNQIGDNELSLYIELNGGDKYPAFATIHTRQPSEVDANQLKLDAIKANAVKMREGFAKCKSSDVEDGLKAIEGIVA